MNENRQIDDEGKISCDKDITLSEFTLNSMLKDRSPGLKELTVGPLLSSMFYDVVTKIYSSQKLSRTIKRNVIPLIYKKNASRLQTVFEQIIRTNILRP